MSALVGYDSSSDEEVDAVNDKPLRVPSPQAHESSDNKTTGLVQRNDVPFTAPSDQKHNEVVIGPVLGPTTPSNGAVAVEQAAPPFPLGDTSEREAIRYLTQAPVPVTSLPPSPPGSPDPAANDRFRRFLELKAKGVHFNEDLSKKSVFKNPSLLSNMMARVGIDEQEQYRTSLPVGLWSPTDFPEWAYKEGLLKSQQEVQGKNEANKKMLSAAGKRTIEFTSESGSGASSRKSTPGQQGKRRRP